MSEPRDEFERRFGQRLVEYLRDGVGELDARKVTAGITADRPRRPGWLWMAVPGAATVAAGAIVTVVLLGVLPRIAGPAGTASQSPSPSVAATATLQPTPVETPSRTPVASQSVTAAWPFLTPSEAPVPTSLDGQGFAFWTLYRPPPCCGSTLRISTSKGSWEDLVDVPDSPMGPDMLVPAGPAGGRVVYVVDEGRIAHLMVGDTRAGADTELTSTDLWIRLLAIDPSGSTAYYLLYDRLDSVFAGLWAIPTRGGEPRLLSAAPATTTMATLAATRVYTPELAVSDDGNWIVFTECQAISCKFHARHPDGASNTPDLTNMRAGDHIVGIASDLLIGSSECPQVTCDGFVLDLVTGERWPLGGADLPFAPAQMIAGPHGPIVLGESDDFATGLMHIDAMDLTNGRRSSAFEAAFQPGVNEAHLAVGNQLGNPADAELPPGWFLILRFNDAAASLPLDYSAATPGAAGETKLPFMEFSHP